MVVVAVVTVVVVANEINIKEIGKNISQNPVIHRTISAASTKLLIKYIKRI